MAAPAGQFRGGKVTPLHEPQSTGHHNFHIPLEEVNPERNVVALLSVSKTANEEGSPDSQLQLIMPQPFPRPALLCACSNPTALG